MNIKDYLRDRGAVFILLAWSDINSLGDIEIVMKEDGFPVFFPSEFAARAYAEANLNFESKIVEITL